MRGAIHSTIAVNLSDTETVNVTNVTRTRYLVEILICTRGWKVVLQPSLWLTCAFQWIYNTTSQKCSRSLRVKLLAKLTDDNRRILIPKFCELLLVLDVWQRNLYSIDESVRPQTSREKDLYTVLASITQQPTTSLSSRWREPALSVHSVQVSGPQSRHSTFNTEPWSLTRIRYK